MLPQHLVDLLGTANVLTGADARPYGEDVTHQYDAQPLAVVRPASTAQVSAVMTYAFENGIKVVPLGGRTGLVGGGAAGGALVISLERMNHIRDIRAKSRIAIVEAGVVMSCLHEAAAAHDLDFPLYFGARGSAMIGGNLSTNAGGSNVLRFGNTRALCLGIEVVLADGRILDLMSELHKDNTGYDLKDLFIGAEGTLGIITAAVFKLVPKTRTYATAMISARAPEVTLDLLNRLQAESGGLVEAFEYMPKGYMQRIGTYKPDLRPPLGHDIDHTILVELGATSSRDCHKDTDGETALTALLQDTLAAMIDQGDVLEAFVAQSAAQRRMMWDIRESAAEISVGFGPVVDCDIALPLDMVPKFFERVLPGVEKMDPGAEPFIVSHLGDGNVHFSVWPTRHDPALMKTMRAMIEDMVVEMGGSFSAEHGIGLTKVGSMSRYKDPVALDVMRQLKAVFDPKGILNPGKVLPAEK